MSRNNQTGKIVLDGVTLFRYMQGTVKNCDLGRSPREARPELFREKRVPRKKELTLLPARHMRNYEVTALTKATPERQRRVLSDVTTERLLKLDADFETWAHKNQLPPSGEGWRTWLMLAGRGFGKTRAGAEWIFRLANGKPGVRIALAGATIVDARSVMVEGVSGLLSVARRYRWQLAWEPSLGRLK